MIRLFIISLVTAILHSAAPTPPADTVSLASRIAAASPGDTIRVHGGFYAEPTLVIDRPLALIGIDEPVLDGQGTNEIINIISDSVTVSGFRFQNVTKTFMSDRSAVRVDQASDCAITDNTFQNTFFGIYLAEVENCLVARNSFEARASREIDGGNGIHSWYSKRLNIRNNDIRRHRDGIYLEFTEHSTVTGNTATENMRYGLHFMFSDRCSYENNRFEGNRAGVAVMYGDEVAMHNNVFRDAWGPSAYGLLLKEIKDGIVKNNRFDGNSVGLMVESTDRMAFTDNTFIDNGWALKLMASAVDNEFTGNAFFQNTFDVATNSRRATSMFDNNYWDRYTGYDLDGNGVGDVPFNPVTLFSLVVEQNDSALFLMRSVLVDMLNAAERVFPALTPAGLEDHRPMMAPPENPDTRAASKASDPSATKQETQRAES